jgi:aminoglycoside 6'-N-acetyltransferase I
MEIVDLTVGPAHFHKAAAQLLVDEFDKSHAWPGLSFALDDVTHVTGEGFARAMLDRGVLVGWIGGLPRYNGRVWELHPLVVHRDFQRRGIGRALVSDFEHEAARRGAMTVTLGTDDDSGMTSLSKVDLYADLPRHLSEIRDLGQGHPFLFYQRLGYTVTGVLPDANGLGYPDILMSKRVAI